MTFFSKWFRKEKTEQKPPKNWMQALFREFDIIYIFVGFLVLYVLLFRVVVVEGASMNQTLVDGDIVLLISNSVYHDPKQGDIIVASKDSFREGECFIKRIIATEGQWVDIDFENRIVYVDGQPLDESYVFFKADDLGPMDWEGVSFPLLVEEGCVFVMGDNRNNSQDSRHPNIGLVDEREILGCAIFLMLPGTNDGKINADYSRIGGIN